MCYAISLEKKDFRKHMIIAMAKITLPDCRKRGTNPFDMNFISYITNHLKALVSVDYVLPPGEPSARKVCVRSKNNKLASSLGNARPMKRVSVDPNAMDLDAAGVKELLEFQATAGVP